MGKIFCLMGKSNSGKDRVLNNLKLDDSLGLKTIVTYTTRPMREHEVNGVQYNFVTKDVIDKLNSEGKVIEQRMYNTIKGDWYYCTVDDGSIDLNDNNYIIITTLESYKDVSIYFGKDNVIPIYLEVEDGIRLSRAIKRESSQVKPNYIELCRRFLSDSEEFTDKNISSVGITKRFNNIDFNTCLEEIKETIKKNICIKS